jgi:hypothetical protein
MEIGGSRRSSHSIFGNKSGSDDFSLSTVDRATSPQQVHSGEAALAVGLHETVCFEAQQCSTPR